MKTKWIEVIREANNDHLSGNGLVCSNHFLSEEMHGSGTRIQLIKGAIPSIFMVECIEYTEESDECDKCNNMKAEIDQLQAKIVKLTLDSQISDAKLNEKIEKLQYLLSEKNQEVTKIKKQLRIINHQKQKIEELERELFTLKTNPSINVPSLSKNVYNIRQYSSVISYDFLTFIFHRLLYLGA